MIPRNFTSDESHILVTCPRGLSGFVSTEIADAGLPVLSRFPTGVRTRGTLDDCISLNLALSTAHHVLYLVFAGTCATPAQLYASVSALEWERIIPLDTTLSVTSTVHTKSITDTRYANLKCKDAIVDRLAAKTGARCNSGPGRDGAVVHLYWQDETCMVYLDTSGETLTRRGYRLVPGGAPMQETLAAAVVRAAAWNGQTHFVNPMCGSGTIAIEAALRALGRMSGTLRDNFGFMHLAQFDGTRYRKLRERFREGERKNLDCRIIATDIDPGAVKIARENARAASVDSVVEFSACEFDETEIPRGDGIVMLNPEYGFRLGVPELLPAVYKRIGDFLKRRCSGYTGYVFSGNFELVKKIGLKAGRKVPFLNGTIECRLYEYELYQGSRSSD
jgi:23S rRNA G2445 N2-methylase RlmL